MSADEITVVARRLRTSLAEAFAPRIEDPRAMKLASGLQADTSEKKLRLTQVPISVAYSAMLIFHRESVAAERERAESGGGG